MADRAKLKKRARDVDYVRVSGANYDDALTLSQKADTGPSIEDLEGGLAIDEHALDEALIEQPDAFYRVSKQLALITSQRDAAKQALQQVEAETDMAIRRESMENDEKVTEREVEARKRIHKDVVRANSKLLDLNQQVGLYTALKEAFQQRSYVLKSLGDLYVAGYFAEASVGSTASGIKDRDASNNRREMQRARERMRGDN